MKNRATTHQADNLEARMDAILDKYAKMDDMEWLSYKREQSARRLKASQKRMKHSYQRIIGKAEDSPITTLGKAEMYLDRFISIYNGVRLGMKVVKLFRGDKDKDTKKRR